MDLHRVVEHMDGYVRIGEDGRIEAVGPWEDLPAGTEASRVLKDSLILPAFVDAHVHLPQLDTRGCYGLPLLPWLERHIFPAEAAFADPQIASETGARFFHALAAAGVGAAGVFTTVHAEATARAFEAAEASGLRAVMGKVLMDTGAPAELLEPWELGIRASLDLAERWNGRGRLHYALTPRFALTSSPDLLEAVGRTAESEGLRIQTHLAEHDDEVGLVAARFPDDSDYLAVYERAGMVREGAVFAHAIHCSDDAYRRIAISGAAIACCPTSNAFLGSGSFPLVRARSAGVTIGVGSDVGAGPQLSPLDVLRHLAYLEQPTPEELLYRGTLGGSTALGLDDVTGRLDTGLAADLVVLTPPPDASGTPLDRFVECVFRQPETDVVATLVDGQIVHGGFSS